MPFPKPPEKVVYDNNPLAEVTAWIITWPLLVIERDRGAAFQEKIRHDYPFLVRDLERGHEFLSEDELWKVLLEPDLLSLSTRVYTRWEHFRGRLNELVEAFRTSYGAPDIKEVQLMYRDIIEPDELGLEPGSWSWTELLSQSFYREIDDTNISSQILRSMQLLELRLQSCPGKLQLSYRLEESREGKEIAIIDSVFRHTFIGDFSDALRHLDAFRELASIAFRWTITDKLHDLLAPRIVDE